MVCKGYRVDGSTTDRFLPDAASLAAVQPVYESLEGWPQEISGARREDDLPMQARRYIEYIEQFVGVPVEIVSVGPDRAQTIRRS